MRKFNQVVDRVLDRMLRSSTVSADHCYYLVDTTCRGCNCCAPQRTRQFRYFICSGTVVDVQYRCC